MSTENPRDTPKRAVLAWLAVMLFFVIGDMTTTYAGLAVGATEAHPISNAFVDKGPLVALGVKGVAVAVAWACYRTSKPSVAWLIPATIGGIGMLLTAWNLAVVFAVAS